jgi:hypothetical protein
VDFVGVLGILDVFVVVKTWWDRGGMRGGCGVLAVTFCGT